MQQQSMAKLTTLSALGLLPHEQRFLIGRLPYFASTHMSRSFSNESGDIAWGSCLSLPEGVAATVLSPGAMTMPVSSLNVRGDIFTLPDREYATFNECNQGTKAQSAIVTLDVSRLSREQNSESLRVRWGQLR